MIRRRRAPSPPPAIISIDRVLGSHRTVHRAGIVVAVFDPTGGTLATSNVLEHGAQLWNPVTRKHVREVATDPALTPGNRYSVSAIAFSRDGTVVAAAGGGRPCRAVAVGTSGTPRSRPR